MALQMVISSKASIILAACDSWAFILIRTNTNTTIPPQIQTNTTTLFLYYYLGFSAGSALAWDLMGFSSSYSSYSDEEDSSSSSEPVLSSYFVCFFSFFFAFLVAVCADDFLSFQLYSFVLDSQVSASVYVSVSVEVSVEVYSSLKLSAVQSSLLSVIQVFLFFCFDDSLSCFSAFDCCFYLISVTTGPFYSVFFSARSS